MREDAGPLRRLTPAERGVARQGIAVAVATGAYGISFGAIAVTSGLDVWQACALSLLAFTGASQYALVGVIGSGGAALSGAATGLMLGTRNTLYGLRLAPTLGLSGVRRLLGAHVVIDESTAMSITRESVGEARVGFWVTGLGIYLLWNLATLLGAVAGDQLGDPRRYGLDAAVGAAFLALLWPRLRTRRNQLTALLGAALALALTPSTPPGVPVLAAAAVAVLMGLRGGPPDPTEIPQPKDLP